MSLGFIIHKDALRIKQSYDTLQTLIDKENYQEVDISEVYVNPINVCIDIVEELSQVSSSELNAKIQKFKLTYANYYGYALSQLNDFIRFSLCTDIISLINTYQTMKL